MALLEALHAAAVQVAAQQQPALGMHWECSNLHSQWDLSSLTTVIWIPCL